MEKKEYTQAELDKMSVDQLREILLKQQSEIKNANKKIDLLTEELTLMMSKKYGRSSEKKIDKNQITFFNEIESVKDKEDSEKPETEKITYTRKKRRKGQRDEELSNLPVEVIEHTISEDILEKELGKDYYVLKVENYKKLKFKPAEFIVEEHHLSVYKSRENGKILRADHPVELMENSLVTPSIAAGVINAKYINHQPLNRIEQEFNRFGVILRRQVMADWMIKLTERYLSLIYDRMRSELFSQGQIHADETPVTVTKDGRKAGSKSYMWVYRSLESNPHNVVLYDYRKTRAGYNLEDYLKEYKGVIVCDGYQAYHSFESNRSGDIKIAGCWVHLLRKFKDSIKSAGGSDKKKRKFLLADEAIKMIQEIIHEDNNLKELTSEERLDKRQNAIRPLVEGFFEWVKSHKDDVTRGSNTGKAFTYALNQESYLKTFLDFPDVPTGNNAAERAIRPFTLGRKNWQIIDTVSGAQNSAVLYGLAETSKANKLNPYEYFKYLLEEIPKHMDDHNLDFLEELLPWSDTLPEICKMKTK